MKKGQEQTYEFALAAMEPQLRIDDGSLIAALSSEYERGHLQFYRQQPGQELWCAIPMRLTLGARLLDAFLDATWPPAFCTDLTAVPGGFAFVFRSNNWDPPDYRFRATYSVRRRAFSLKRLDRVQLLTPEQRAQVKAQIDDSLRDHLAGRRTDSPK